ncbi:MAG: IS4/IS5 family transposase, partial [Candidatus Sumerlaeia bacterium]|nr:IS4/IS5 family transposase [Candidatus Sumerlaeia bacterium]
LASFLPDGWQAKARETGALRRCRKVPDAPTLLRVLLIHLAEGCSLRETAVRARQGNLVALSDVAIMDRLKGAGEWFRWMNTELMKKWAGPGPTALGQWRWNVRVIDGTRVKEPGPTGSSWCVHYSLGLPSLACQELVVSEPNGRGESFTRFHVRAFDLFLGDRAYGVRPGIVYVCRNGGEVLGRFALSNLPLVTRQGQSFSLLTHLRTLTATQRGDWPVLLKDSSGEVPGRVCAVRKSRPAA